MDTVYHARRWMKRWSGLFCSEITIQLITQLRDERSKISNHTANKELRYLRSLFNFIIKAKGRSALFFILTPFFIHHKRKQPQGATVTLIGFGTFSVTERAARTGRNPQTGKALKIAAKKVAKFNPGKVLSDSVN
jgi:nucleoid DNA-binding protein